jgi:hypothetical protein
MVVAVVVIVAITTTFRFVVTTIFGGRRLDRSGDPPTSSLNDARLSRLEHAVDAIALEVERISEGQRFTTNLLSEQARQTNKLGRELSNTPT